MKCTRLRTRAEKITQQLFPQTYCILTITNMAGSSTLTSAIVIGAGFAGLSVAIELAKRGVKVIVFESAPDMKRQGKRRN